MKAKVKNVMITGLILLGFYIVVKIMLNVFLILKAERLNDIFFDHIAGKQYNEDLKKTEALLMDITDNIHGGMLLSIDAYTYSSDYMEEVADSYPKWERDLFETYYDYEFVPINELKKYNFDRLGHIRYNVPEEERDNENPLASLHYGIRPLSGAYASSEAAYMLISWIGLAVMIVIIFIRHSQFAVFFDEKNEESAAYRLSEELSREMIAPLEALKKATSDWKNADESERDLYSGGIMTEVDRMNDVIKKILKVRGLEQGRVDVECEEFNLYRFTSSVVEHLDPVLKKKGISVSVDSANGDECIVNADPEIMNMVISSMIIKTAENSDKRIMIVLRAGMNVSLEVKSDTLWADKKEAKGIWNKYGFADQERAGELGSNGIGLVPAGVMLKAHKASFGCTAGTDGTILWFKLKKADY